MLIRFIRPYGTYLFDGFIPSNEITGLLSVIPIGIKNTILKLIYIREHKLPL
jgi:hypothetical protein